MNESVKSLGQNVTKARFQSTLLSTVETVATILSKRNLLTIAPISFWTYAK